MVVSRNALIGTLIGIAISLPAEGQSLKRRSPSSVAEQRVERRAEEKAEEDAADRGAQRLEEARTMGDLTRLVGVVPKCTELDQESRICSWDISNRMPGYKLLASLVRTDARVSLICELPNDNSPRAPLSCTVGAPRRESQNH